MSQQAKRLAFEQMIRLNNGLPMPRLGLGTGFLNEAKQIEHAITNVGYRKIDTASIMQNEKQVGNGIKKALESGNVTREDLFVTAKLWHTGYDDPDEALEKSLEKLNQ